MYSDGLRDRSPGLTSQMRVTGTGSGVGATSRGPQPMAKQQKATAKKPTKRVGMALPLTNDFNGPCAQTDQAVSECAATAAGLATALSGFMTLLANPPTVASYAVLSPAGVWSWEPL